jgi:hypothetical protein
MPGTGLAKLVRLGNSRTYQPLENALSCCCTAGLDFPDVVLGNLLQLQAV